MFSALTYSGAAGLSDEADLETLSVLDNASYPYHRAKLEYIEFHVCEPVSVVWCVGRYAVIETWENATYVSIIALSCELSFYGYGIWEK